MLNFGWADWVHAEGIPEPPVTVYGVVRNQGVRVVSGTLVWTWRPSDGGPSISATTTLTNIIDQFSYVISIPCETPFQGGDASSGRLRIQNPAVTYVRTDVALNGQPLTFRDAAQGSLAAVAGLRGLVEQVDLEVGSGHQIVTYEEWSVKWMGSVQPRDGDGEGDGMNNYAEYLAGTNPTDPLSLLRFGGFGGNREIGIQKILNANNALAAIDVSWTTVIGKSYSVARSSTISANGADYTLIPGATGLKGNGGYLTFRDLNVGGQNTNFFYRIQLDQ